MARMISVFSQNFIAMDNTKSSEPMKEKVKWLTPGKICEQTVDSNSDLTGNDTMWMKRKVMKKWALSHCYKKDGHPHRAVIQNVLEHNRCTVPVHSVPLKMMAVNTVGYTDTHHSNQQPHVGHYPAAHQTVWYILKQEAPEARAMKHYA